MKVVVRKDLTFPSRPYTVQITQLLQVGGQKIQMSSTRLRFNLLKEAKYVAAELRDELGLNEYELELERAS